jgi:hypothetical protein
MVAMCFLAIASGYGAASIEKWAAVGRGGWRRLVLPTLGAFFVLEACSMPVPVKSIDWARRDGRPGVVTAAELDRLYAFIRTMPRGTVVAEFPFGDLQSEIRAVFLSTRHGHPILNGYSGGFPASYDARVAVLGDPLVSGEGAWEALVSSGATCVVVHQWAFEGGNGAAFSGWLLSHGAVPLATFKGDRLFGIGR